MNITVFGATGAIGQLTVQELLVYGHHVTAYARNPEKVPTNWGDQVRVIIGEMSDAKEIDQAISGADAVISTLGPDMSRRTTGLPLVEGVRNILNSMEAHGISRFIAHGTPSVLDPRDRKTFKTRFSSFMARTFLPRAYEELIGMAQLIRSSNTEWTLVRFLAPTNDPKTGHIRVGFFGQDSLGMKITRSDIAAFTAEQVTDTTYIHSAPAITN